MTTFEDRVIEAFGGASISEIAEKIGENYHTLRNWLKERTQIPNFALAKIANQTNVSLNWLLTDEGEKFINGNKQINLDETFRAVVREIVREEIGESIELNEKIQGVFLTMQSNVESFDVKENAKGEKSA